VPAGLPQPADDAEPVQSRHHHVEDQQIGAEGLRERQRLLAVRGGGDLEPGVAQAGRQQLADVRLVVDDEEPRLRGGAGVRGAGHGSSGRASVSRHARQPPLRGCGGSGRYL
jgi:hypothetical protein